MKDYYRWRTASMTCFNIHYLSFWRNPNNKDFEGVMDAFMMAYLAQIMYLFDTEKKFHQNLVVGVPLFLAVLSFGREREIDLMFHAIISLISEQIKKRNQYIIMIKPYKKHLYYMIYIRTIKTMLFGNHI